MTSKLKSASSRSRRASKQKDPAAEIASNLRMRIESVDVFKVELDPENANSHNRRNIDLIKASLRIFGQRRNIVLSLDRVVIAGNGVVIAARELVGEGQEKWRFLDADISPLTGVEAKAYGLVDNRSAELAEWDFKQLAQNLKDVKENFDLPELGWLDYESSPLLEADWRPPSISENTCDDRSDASKADPIIVTPDQRVVIDRAIERVREQEGDDMITEGRAVELICADFIANL